MRTMSAWRLRSSMKVCGKRIVGLVLELSYHFYLANNILVELFEVFSGYPIFPMDFCAYYSGFITVEKRLSYTKPHDITTFRLVIFCIPIASDLSCVFLVQNRIEDRLFR